MILNIYKEIKVILDRHHLRYFAIGGTCIGAVRHQGFIPWDDDLDIGLPDADYDRFLKIAEQELPPHLGVVDCTEQRGVSALSAKVFDKNTTFIEAIYRDNPDACTGVFVDIFKLSGCPDDERERARFFKRLRMLCRLNEKRRLRFSQLERTRSKLLWLAVLPMKALPYCFWSDRIKKLTDAHPYDAREQVIFSWDSHFERLMMARAAVYGDGVDLPFEDTEVRCASDYDTFLTVSFGDYMTLPPENERRAKHSDNSIIDLSRPYRVPTPPRK